MLANAIASETPAELTASLGVGSARTSITVLPIAPPNLTVPVQIAGKALRAIQFSVFASDPSGLGVSVASLNLPPGATLIDGLFSWVPNNSQAGMYTVTITATNSAQVSTASDVIVVVKPRNPAITGIYNAADPSQGVMFPVSLTAGTNGACSPGELATLVGAGLTPLDPETGSQVPMRSDLAGLQVLVNGDPVPLSYASDTLVKFQCPLLDPGVTLSIQGSCGG